MVKLTIDGRAVEAAEEMTILAAARSVGIEIPTLCYFPGLNDIGACRVCVVEIVGQERLVAACNTPVAEGIEVLTDSPRARQARKSNVELILSQHNTECTSCIRSGNCTLQTIANDLNLINVPYEVNYTKEDWNPNFPLIRDSSKCIKCMRCIQVCDNVQAVHAWTVKNRGKRTTIGVTEGVPMEHTKCVLCGQCITHCPVGALTARDDTMTVMEAINDPEITTVVQVAPAVRSAWGESLGMTHEEATEGLMVNALRKIGFDYVFDTDWAADLTIMEEANEFLERLAHKDEYQFPMFTSCCPGWVRYMKGHRPDQIPMLSTSKSPQQMFGPAVKTLFKKTKDLDPEKVFCVSIMPCVAKKYECAVEELRDVSPIGDVDASLTTREMIRLAKAHSITAEALEEDQFDNPLGVATGAGVIFGATGGVMEAALRTAYYAVVGENPDPDAFKDVRGIEGWREATFDLNGTPLRVAIASGLANTERLLQALDNGEVEYDFVEIMACPGGCAGGGGQPIKDGFELAASRHEVLYRLDRENSMRFSHENPQIDMIYKEIYEKPLSELAEEHFHTDQAKWDMVPTQCK